MKKILLCIAAAMVCIGSQAQGLGFKWGVKAGVNVQTAEVKNLVQVGDLAREMVKAKNRMGWHVGLQTSFGVGFASIRPELLYTRTSFRFNAGSQFHSTVKVNSVDVPVLLSLRLLGPVAIEVGPSFNLMNNSKMKGGDEAFVKLDASSRPTMSYLVGVAVNIGNLSITGRYNGEFKRYKHSFFGEASETAFSVRTGVSSWQFGVGIFF